MSIAGRCDENRCWCRSFLVFGIVLVLSGMWCSSVWAHPPSSIEVSYEVTSGLLVINVAHNSNDITIHNIARLSILRNGNEIPEGEIRLNSWGEDSEGLIATYNLSVTQGDDIVVVAECSEYGLLSGKIVVDMTNGGNGSNTSTPGFELVVVVGALLFVWVVKRRL
ncbi:MAG: hypothetical protein KKC68_03295 [Candidatus Thermoplasmatota archaeon]|nr:hypothetical protein [Candidatus Thermoplasmatota archaeon]MBU1940778.1 hypothetical protein [Candidatus Thermoplasmatota archaeon]